MSDFIAYLLKGFAVVSQVFAYITFDIYNTTFSLIDLMSYTAIIGFSLSLIDRVSKTGVLNKGRGREVKANGRH